MLSPRKEEQYLEILSDVEYSGDVQRVVIIKFVESGLEQICHIRMKTS